FGTPVLLRDTRTDHVGARLRTPVNGPMLKIAITAWPTERGRRRWLTRKPGPVKFRRTLIGCGVTQCAAFPTQARPLIPYRTMHLMGTGLRRPVDGTPLEVIVAT